MEPALDPSLNEADYAGASMVTATVDPEDNKLVIGLSVLNESTVLAAQAVFGTDTLFRQEDIAVATAGPDRWKDRYPYSGGAGYAPTNWHVHSPVCTGGFAVRRATDARQFMVTAGHCIGTVAVSTYNAANSLVGMARHGRTFLEPLAE